MLRVSFAFLRGGVSFLGFAGFAAFAAAFFALRSARQARNFAFSFPSGPLGSSGSAGSGFGYWNTGNARPSAPAFTVKTPCSHCTSAQNGQNSTSANKTIPISSKMPTNFNRKSSTAPSAEKSASSTLIRLPPLFLLFRPPHCAPEAGPPGWTGQSTVGRHRSYGS